MDWQIAERQSSCGQTGKTWTAGDHVQSQLRRLADGTLERLDISKGEEFPPAEGDTPVLARWSWIVPEPQEARPDKRDQFRGQEELFVSLFPLEADEGLDPEAREDRHALRFLLALSLCRRRVLRQLPGGGDGELRFQRTKGDESFRFPTASLDGARMDRLGPLLDDFLS
jgi:hypothetical protein